MNVETASTTNTTAVAGSFRDPSGSLFARDTILYRHIADTYRDAWTHANSSGLYAELIQDGLLIPHEEVDPSISPYTNTYKVIRPQRVPFISYPYEWCFSELRAAALTTLAIQRKALEHDMTLKDASAYNIQFLCGIPLCIDTLSFERYEEGNPWEAYGQFCRHFLAPLALMKYRDARLGQMARLHIDGIPLHLASVLLPMRTYLHPSLLMHVHLHAKGESAFAEHTKMSPPRVPRKNLLALLDHLEASVRRFDIADNNSFWANYYENTNYSPAAFQEKKTRIAKWLHDMRPQTVWDLGGNTGEFSAIAAEQGAHVVSFDVDHAAVERQYVSTRRVHTILPLVLDLTNPSPALGWAHTERMSLVERGPADVVLALALIHHLAIANNVPLSRIASYLHQLTRTSCIVEFIPKTDTQVQRLLATRHDIFPSYDERGFEQEFAKYFSIKEIYRIPNSERTLYRLMK